MTIPRWATDESLKKNNFDFLRFFFAALVIFSHSFAVPVGSDDTEPLLIVTRGQVTLGGLAVDSFFMISGFLISLSWVRGRGVRDFAKKRALRIYPGFFVVTLLGVIAAVACAREPLALLKSVSPVSLVFKTLILAGYEPLGSFADLPFRTVNGSLWSIPYEVWCYVGVAVLGVIGLLTRRTFLLPLFFVSIVGSVVFVILDLTPGGKILGVIFGAPVFWARLLPFYLAGMVFFQLRDRIPSSPVLVGVCVLALVVAARVPAGMSVALPTAGGYLLFSFAFSSRVPLAGWGRRGDFSYGLYLYAFPIQQMLLAKLGLDVAPMLLFVAAFPCVLAAAVASWFLIEKPALALKRARAPAQP